ncbi:hypothetical protein J7394_14460 [Ruegeria sp. R13_0]|uniref:hypothetical protein n=1 Tax=Ruegeria sp. R13_0 TaxID=2821099 RepID=UPI001ADABDC9|nr:hypothetical protein [Ruegeria sp. R13_0]MBO9435417.1 hypothetical protein [Ruegeria sp. R13_0]
MQNVTVTSSNRFDLNDILDADEKLLWSGVPGYGRKFIQAVGDERKVHVCLLIASLVMWATLPFIDVDAEFGRFEAYWIYGAMTFAFVAFSFSFATQRHYVLFNLAYFVTDRRVIICRRGRNWRFGVRLYIVSVEHSATFPYSIVDSRPYPSLEVGILLSEQQVQPFGLGLTHPGHPVLFGRTYYPILLDYVPEATKLLSMIRTCLNDTADSTRTSSE